MEHIGIDVHKRTSQVCICTETGELVERKIATARETFAKLLGSRPRCRIVIEASTESEWVARCLEELGHEVIVADPNFAAMYASRSRKVKTDRRDARALCEASRLGAYRPSHRTSDTSRHRRAQVAAREVLVRTRTKFISLMGALVRREGYRIRTGGAANFATRLEELSLPEHLREETAPLLTVMVTVNEQIKAADRRLEQIVKDDEVAQRLCTVPSVGPVTAVTFLATIDRVERFDNAGQVRAYLGLVPRLRWPSAACLLASVESRPIDGAAHHPNPTLRRGSTPPQSSANRRMTNHLVETPNREHNRRTERAETNTGRSA